MRNKYKNRIINEANNKVINLVDRNLLLNSTINEFKDINIKKIFIKKQLTINNEKNINKEKKMHLNTINNDIKLYKHAHIRKKLYPQSKDLLSPEYKNIIEKTNIVTDNPSINLLNVHIKKINDINNNKEKNDLIKSIDKENNPLLNTIQVKRKNTENINQNEYNNKIKYNISQFDKTINNNNNNSNNNSNNIYNYTKKKIIFHSKNRSIINRKPIININKNDDEINEKNETFNKDKMTKSVEKSKNRQLDIINNNTNYLKTEENQKLLQLKKTLLIFPKK